MPIYKHAFLRKITFEPVVYESFNLTIFVGDTPLAFSPKIASRAFGKSRGGYSF